MARGDNQHYYFLSTDPDFKILFANWVVQTSITEPDILEPLRKVMEGMNKVLAPPA
jgi:hypothetical protein